MLINGVTDTLYLFELLCGLIFISLHYYLNIVFQSKGKTAMSKNGGFIKCLIFWTNIQNFFVCDACRDFFVTGNMAKEINYMQSFSGGQTG